MSQPAAAGEEGAKGESGGDAGAVLGDVAGIVARTEAAIQRPENTVADTALAREETMVNAVETVERWSGDLHVGHFGIGRLDCQP